jgi:hypothetical protein
MEQQYISKFSQIRDILISYEAEEALPMLREMGLFWDIDDVNEMKAILAKSC